MRIFVLGNLNSGKSWLCQQLAGYLDDYSILSLDDYRLRLGDGTITGELAARQAFSDAVLSNDNAIVDFTGIGEFAEQLQNQLAHCCGIALIRTRSDKECLANLSMNKYEAIPYPEEFKRIETPEATISRLAGEVSKLEEQWKPFVWQTYSVPHLNDGVDFISGLSIEHHMVVDKIRVAANNNDEIISAITYGSIGAGTVNRLSDIDIFIETHCDVDTMHGYFCEYFADEVIHSDILKQKITLRLTNCILVELTCGKELTRTEVYYRESRIKHPESTILKGDDSVLEHLKIIVENHISVEERAKPICADLYFLLCSLPALLEKEDTYKYHFHVNIMQHYSLQLEALLADETSHNYLPKYAAQKLPAFPWHCFKTDPTLSSRKQYSQLLSYIKILFHRLELKGLIKPGHYFTDSQMCLHTLP